MGEIKLKDDTKKDAIALVWKSMLAYGLWTVMRLAFTKTSVLNPMWRAINDFIASFYVAISAKTLQYLGYTIDYNDRNLLLGDNGDMYVGDHCLGISAMVIFLLIILFLKGKGKHKLWYSLLGLTVIFLVNWFRIVGLSLMLKFGSPGFFHFNHSYTYLVLVYGIIFLLITRYESKVSKR